MKKKKIILIVILVLFVLGLIVTISINQHVKNSTKNKILDNFSEISDFEAILILGCQVNEDSSLSTMLKDRLDKGIELYKEGVAPKVIVSGDHRPVRNDETTAMKKYMMDNGVPSEDIFMDHSGYSTYDSMYRAKYIFELKKCVIVTQEYHLYRAMYIGNSMGVETYGAYAKKENYTGQLKRDFREFLARNKDFVKCILKPESTDLGNIISINGNGDITNNK